MSTALLKVDNLDLYYGDAQALAAQVVVVSYGEKIAEGTPNEISRNQAVLDVYLGEEEVA